MPGPNTGLLLANELNIKKFFLTESVIIILMLTFSPPVSSCTGILLSPNEDQNLSGLVICCSRFRWMLSLLTSCLHLAIHKVNHK